MPSIFKLKSDAPPTPPPKEPSSAFYHRSLFTRSTASLTPSPDSNSGPPTPLTPYPFILTDVAKPVIAPSPVPSLRNRDHLPSPSLDGASTDSSGSCPNAPVPMKHKKGVFKLANLAKRNRSKKDLSDTASASGSTSTNTTVSDHPDTRLEGDDGISLPWNFQHNIHVDEGYIGLPPSWSAALSQVGFDEGEIAAIHARRRAAASTISKQSAYSYSTERPPSPQTLIVPPTLSATSSATLFDPVPRSTSLGKGRDVLSIHPPSIYSPATTIASGPPSAYMGTSPAPSPRAPSFSMRSFVSGIKNSLSSDSASARGVGSSRGGGGDESEPYVIVEGNGSDKGATQGMGDETLIEPYPFDTSTVSSHTSMSQDSLGQQTPRTLTFPQIQVQRAQSENGHVPFPCRGASPLAHSASLPIPTPPRGYTYSGSSLSVSPSHSFFGAGPRSAPPPRTPPRRIYHVVNASSDSCNEDHYPEPPPAYASPVRDEWIQRKEKDGSGIVGGPPLPKRPIPPLPTEGISGEPSSTSHRVDREVSVSQNGDYTMDSMDIPETADDVLDISSYYNDTPVHTPVHADMQPAKVSPIPPLVIDKRMSNLAMLPPRISLHQEDTLDDWSESLFSAIEKGKQTCGLMEPNDGDVARVKKERRTTIRPIPLLTNGSVSVVASNSVSPSLPEFSFGAELTLGPHVRDSTDSVEEGDEQAQPDKAEDCPENDRPPEPDTTAAAEEKEVASSTPVLPDVSFGPNVSSIGKDLDPPTSESSTPQRPSTDSIPPTPPPKPKYIPPPITLPPPIAITPPKTNIITGISGKSPVNPLFGLGPQPLPIPIPLSQIRAQLRPAPPKAPHPPPMLPLPPLKRTISQPNLQPLPPPPQTQLPPIPTQKASAPVSPASTSGPRHNPSQTLLPTRPNANPGDRDSGLSTITVTPVTIATAKTEVVRTAIASVIDSDTVSLASNRESIVSAAGRECNTEGPDGQTPRSQTHDTSMVSEVSSVSLLRDGPQSKWPAPPPPPIEMGTDASTRRVSRFRTTSLGRVTQLQAMGGTTPSPTSTHSTQMSSDTSSETHASPPVTTRGLNGVCATGSRVKGRLAAEARMLCSTTDTFGGVDAEMESGDEGAPPEMPTLDSRSTLTDHPLLVQLRPYITPCDPSLCFTNLIMIAEGESGSVYAAQVAEGQQATSSTERSIPPGTSHVAIKRIPLPPAAASPASSDDTSVSTKLTSVLHELTVLAGLEHTHLLLLDGVYVGLDVEEEGDGGASASAVDTSLWIRMELMERSLADVIGLVAEGLALQERLVARFASDVLHGLDYLQKEHMAHRDVRSDNVLVNADGVVKLADFSSAIRVDSNAPTVTEAVGVIYWQAPEMRAGPYNALKVDVWSLGATVWELAETVPPFSMPASPSVQVSFAVQAERHVGSQWPPLSHPEHYSRAFHEFLRLCGRESAERPSPGELLNTSFVHNACGRPVILQLLSQCRSIEEGMVAKEATGTSSSSSSSLTSLSS